MIISSTPLRISFTGGGTDFPDFYQKHGGAVVSCAIDKFITVSLEKREDDLISISGGYSQVAKNLDEVEHDLIRESLKRVGVCKGIDIDIGSDITSEGSGLGSSSCLTIGLLKALAKLKEKEISPEELAQEACIVEIQLLGKPIGKQDQYICSYGGLRYIEFLKNESVKTQEIEIPFDGFNKLQKSLMLFFTGITRKSALILDEQKRQIVSNEKILLKMKDQSAQLLELFKKGEVDSLGEILDEGWSLKKQLASRITNLEIDELYIRAKKAGARGGKIAGAGGGGFLLLYVPLEKQTAVERSLDGFKRLPIGLSRDGSKILV